MSSPATQSFCSGPRRIAADVIWVVHIAVMLFLVVGWTLPWRAAWWTYVGGAPVVLLGWRVFANTCWLSILESKLRGEPVFSREVVSGTEQSRSFVAETLSSVLRRPVSRGTAKRLSYGVLYGGFLVSAARLALA